MVQDEACNVFLQQDPTGPLGQLYQGQFKDQMKHGKGVLHFQVPRIGRLVYEGEFVQDKKHGYGVLTWPDGRRYTGHFANDDFDGAATMTWPDGNKYVGHFANDDFDGAATMTWPDGNKYVGHYANGKKDGMGVLSYPSGSKCVAHFRRGERHGSFTYFKADGTKKHVDPEGHEFTYKADKICEEETGSLSSKTTSASSAPLPETPQRWRVVDYGGVVVRSTSSFKSRKLGTIPQGVELWVIGAEGRRLKVSNPVEGWSIGWMSASTEDGLVLMERVDQMEESERSSRSTQSLREKLFPRAQASEGTKQVLRITDNLFRKLGL